MSSTVSDSVTAPPGAAGEMESDRLSEPPSCRVTLMSVPELLAVYLESRLMESASELATTLWLSPFSTVCPPIELVPFLRTQTSSTFRVDEEISNSTVGESAVVELTTSVLRFMDLVSVRTIRILLSFSIAA